MCDGVAVVVNCARRLVIVDMSGHVEMDSYVRQPRRTCMVCVHLD
jgi:hypothetical protein